MTDNYIIYDLNRSKKLMHQYLDVLLKKEGIVDLVPAYSDVVTALFLNDGQLKMHQISTLVGKDKSTVTVLVNRLIERGYIVKIKSELDRRVSYIHLTEKAKGKLEVFNRIADTIRSVAFDGFSPEEIELYNAFVERIITNFEEELNE